MGGGVGLVAGVVGEGVVAGAEQPAGRGVGGSAAGPGVVVVGVAQPGWGVAALGGAAAVAVGEGDPLGFGVEAARAAEVEDLGRAAEDGGDDPGPAGQPARLAGGDAAAGVQRRRRQAAQEGLEGMVTTTVAQTPPALPDRVGGPGLDVLAERLPQPVLRLGCSGGRVRSLGAWARRCLRSIAPCRAGIVNRPWQRPWPSSTIVNDAAARAALSPRPPAPGPHGPRRSRGRPRPGSGGPAPATPSRRGRGRARGAPSRPRPPPRGRSGRRGGRRPRPR